MLELKFLNVSYNAEYILHFWFPMHCFSIMFPYCLCSVIYVGLLLSHKMAEIKPDTQHQGGPKSENTYIYMVYFQVDKEGKTTQAGGSTSGGRLFLGLGSLLTGAKVKTNIMFLVY